MSSSSRATARSPRATACRSPTSTTRPDRLEPVLERRRSRGRTARARASLDYAFRSDDNTTLQGLVAARFGVALMPLLAIQPGDDRVKVLALDPPVPDPPPRCRLAPRPAPFPRGARVRRDRAGRQRRRRARAQHHVGEQLQREHAGPGHPTASPRSSNIPNAGACWRTVADGTVDSTIRRRRGLRLAGRPIAMVLPTDVGLGGDAVCSYGTWPRRTRASE